MKIGTVATTKVTDEATEACRSHVTARDPSACKQFDTIMLTLKKYRLLLAFEFKS